MQWPMDTSTSDTTPSGATGGTGRRQKLARLCQRAGLLPGLGRLRDLLREDLRILAYHRVLESIEPPGFHFDLDLVSASAECFRAQMTLIRRRFHPLRFDDLIAHLDAGRRLPPRAVLVTFDDGYDDNYRVAFPILRELDLSAMFFVSTGHVDSGQPYAFDWLVHMLCTTRSTRLDAPELGIEWNLPSAIEGRRSLAATLLDRIKALDDAAQSAFIARLEREWGLSRRIGHADCRPMSWDQLREMQRGGMEIGSHGVDHRMLAKLPADRLAAEVNESKAALERELGVPAQVLSYPVGGADAFDPGVVSSVRAAGFRLGCSYIAGTSVLRPESCYELRRLPVERDMDLAWFEAMLTLPEVFGYTSRTHTR